MKIPVTVSIEIEARAVVTVEVEENVRGSFGSVEKRAKDHVLAALAIGAEIPWKVEYDVNAICALNPYKFEATTADQTAEAPPPAPKPIEPLIPRHVIEAASK